MHLTQSKLDSLKSMACAVAPELAGDDFNVMNASDFVELPDQPKPTAALGFAIRRYNGARGIWLDAGAVKEHCQDFDAGLNSLTLHEAAHLLPVNQTATERLQNFLAEKPEERPDDRSHDWRFLRRLLHLATRAIWQGFSVPIVGCSSLDWITDELTYQWTLQTEIFALRNLTFTEIETIQPPQAFLQTWRFDMKALKAEK